MEFDEVDAATESVQQLADALYMGRGIVDAVEHNVLEGYATLATKVVVAQGVDNLLYGVNLLNGHQFFALLIKGRVHADGQVGFAFFDERSEERRVGKESSARLSTSLDNLEAQS